MTKRYVQYVMVEEGTTNTVSVEKLVSSKPITFKSVLQFYEKERNFDWHKDSISLLDSPDLIIINLDAF